MSKFDELYDELLEGLLDEGFSAKAKVIGANPTLRN
jgi:hypothetical protein